MHNRLQNKDLKLVRINNILKIINVLLLKTYSELVLSKRYVFLEQGTLLTLIKFTQLYWWEPCISWRCIFNNCIHTCSSLPLVFCVWNVHLILCKFHIKSMQYSSLVVYEMLPFHVQKYFHRNFIAYSYKFPSMKVPWNHFSSL